VWLCSEHYCVNFRFYAYYQCIQTSVARNVYLIDDRWVGLCHFSVTDIRIFECIYLHCTVHSAYIFLINYNNRIRSCAWKERYDRAPEEEVGTSASILPAQRRMNRFVSCALFYFLASLFRFVSRLVPHREIEGQRRGIADHFQSPRRIILLFFVDPSAREFHLAMRR
jgi:hypothetical protein